MKIIFKKSGENIADFFFIKWHPFFFPPLKATYQFFLYSQLVAITFCDKIPFPFLPIIMDIFICMYISEKDHKQKCWQWWGSSRGDVGLPIMMLNLQKYCRNVLFPIDRQPNNLQFMNETETLHSVKSWCQNWEGVECGHWDLWMSQSFRFLTWEILWSRWWTQISCVESESLLLLGTCVTQKGAEKTDGHYLKCWG